MADVKKSAPKITDVSKPGKTAPSTTSKPVIVTNRPLLQDPMVTPAGEEPTAGASVATKPVAKDTEPIVEKADNTRVVTPPSEAEPTAQADETPTATPAKEKIADTPEQSKPDTASDEKTTDDDIPTDAKKSVDEAAEAEAAKQAEHEAAIQKLVDSKQYALPINSVEQRKSKRFVVVGVLLAVILAVAWVDVALDAGLIHLGNVKPVTHFFSN